MTTHDRGAPRSFYEDLAARHLPRSTVRGIAYRNLTVARHLRGAGTRVLEIGPGEGWLTRILAGRGHRVVAVDLARSWLTALPPTLPGRVAAAITGLPFAPGSFDAAVAAEVLEHVPDATSALCELRRVLVPGGKLVLTVPYRETLSFVSCPECGRRFEVNGHVHTFDEASLAALLAAAGFRTGEIFVGPTRFSREILRRAPIAPLLPLLAGIDRMSYRTQRVSDTWLLMTASRD
jgi:SAM-dependent methyltransferase